MVFLLCCFNVKSVVSPGAFGAKINVKGVSLGKRSAGETLLTFTLSAARRTTNSAVRRKNKPSKPN